MGKLPEIKHILSLYYLILYISTAPHVGVYCLTFQPVNNDNDNHSYTIS